MASIKFSMVSFYEDENSIIARLYKLFEVAIPKDSFGSAVHSKGNTLQWENVNKEEGKKRFSALLSAYLDNLHNIATKKNALFIHGNSGIPLIGSLAFGIVDRGTNIIEVKPITGCNINCTFCSVGEGADGKKCWDYVVEREYLVNELNKVLEFKKEPMDIWINTHGEPMLYSEIIPLISDIEHLQFVNNIALITNGTLLSKKFLVAAKKAGLTQLNVSVNAIDDKRGKALAGTRCYNGLHVQKMVEIAVNIFDVAITPVYLRGHEQDIEEVIAFAQRIGCYKVYVQNFLAYKSGRNPAKEVEWKAFEHFLRDLQTKYLNVELLVKNHTAKHTKPLQKPFKTGDKVIATVVAQGRVPWEILAAANGRCITVSHCNASLGKKTLIKITGDKDNIFYGKCLK